MLWEADNWGSHSYFFFLNPQSFPLTQGKHRKPVFPDLFTCFLGNLQVYRLTGGSRGQKPGTCEACSIKGIREEVPWNTAQSPWAWHQSQRYRFQPPRPRPLWQRWIQNPDLSLGTWHSGSTLPLGVNCTSVSHGAPGSSTRKLGGLQYISCQILICNVHLKS